MEIAKSITNFRRTTFHAQRYVFEYQALDSVFSVMLGCFGHPTNSIDVFL